MEMWWGEVGAWKGTPSGAMRISIGDELSSMRGRASSSSSLEVVDGSAVEAVVVEALAGVEALEVSASTSTRS